MSRRAIGHASFLALLGRAMAEPAMAIDADFPDPSLIQVNSLYWAFATEGNGVNGQVAYSEDFTDWTRISGYDALPGPFPSWVDSSSPAIWAPDVLVLADGSFVMYYSATTSNNTALHCVGAATAITPEGPYTPVDDFLACPLDQGGAIDADGFIDTDGTIYVVYKVDGDALNSDGTQSTPIMLQQMESDGTTPTGDPIELIDRSAIDGPDIEAPSLLLKNGIYYLGFSSNVYWSQAYDTSYAYATSIKGPWTKQSSPYAPLLTTGVETSNAGALSAPGGADFSVDGTKMVFHADLNGANDTNGRAMFVSEISEANDVITLD